MRESVLNGKKILFLGSSVTYGSAAGGYSFVECLENAVRIIPYKEAVSGTTLVTDEPESYIQRLKQVDQNLKFDIFVCQLSTNDASKGKTLGKICNNQSMKQDAEAATENCTEDAEQYDTTTVAGAIESIIAYVKEIWGCPVVFYTGTKYSSEAYEKMVQLLYAIQEKWQIGVIDLWNNPELNAVTEEDYHRYMADGVHPTREGYEKWWTPVIQTELEQFLR